MKKLYFALLLGCAIYLLTGCVTFRKQQLRAEKFYHTYPNELAKLCAYTFPPKTELKPGRDTITQTDTLSVAVNCPPSGKDTVVFTKILQRTKYRVDTLYKTRTAVEDSLRARVVMLGEENKQAAIKNEKLEQEHNKLMSTTIGISIICVFLLILVARSFIKAF